MANSDNETALTLGILKLIFQFNILILTKKHRGKEMNIL